MGASYLATVIIFCSVGIYSLGPIFFGDGTITGIGFADVLVTAIILLNAIFFLYVELYSETNQAEIDALRKVHISQWILRVINQANLTMTWFWLKYGLIYTISSLLVFYIVILIWDSVVFRTDAYFEGRSDGGLSDKKGLNIVRHDMVGFGTIFMLWGFVFYFEYWNADVLSDQGVVNTTYFNEISLMMFMLGVSLFVFAWNAYHAIKEIPINFSDLFSNDKRY